MILVQISEEQIQLADAKARDMGLLKNSITRGEGSLVGFLGEILVVKHFGGVIENTYDYDVIINGRKIDVKTKRTTVVPLDTYLATVAGYNTRQACDSYYFVRIDLSKKEGYLLGGLSKSAFFRKATFYKKGELDPSSHLGWTFTADCYNVEIRNLKK